MLQDLTFSGYSWFKWSGNSLIDYRKNAGEKQPFSGFCQMQRASGEGIGFDSQCAILYSVKGEIKEKGSPGEAASAAEQHGACSVDVCSGGTGCVLSLCFFFFPFGRTSAFSLFICQRDQAPACAEAGGCWWQNISYNIISIISLKYISVHLLLLPHPQRIKNWNQIMPKLRLS